MTDSNSLYEEGQTVWLAWVFENNPGLRYTSGTPGKAVSSQYWAGQMPSEFGSSSSSSYKYSICANYAAKYQQQEIELTGNPYMFTARAYDIETGLYYYRARYYNPYIGRFLQIDPAYSSMNLYAYCGNNPINCTDPMGLEYLSTTAKITYKLKNDPCEYHIKLKSFKDFNDWLTGLKNSAKTITFFEIITHGAHAPGDTDGLGFMLGMDVFGIGQTNINNPKEKWYGIDDYNSLILSVFDPCATIELEYCYSANGFHCLGKELKKLLPTANIYGYTGKCKQFPGVWETRPVLWGSEWVTINSNGTVAPVTPPIWLSPHYSLAWSDFTPYI